MPWHHRYIGNPLLSGFLNLLFHTGVSDAHCGMRALRRDAPGAPGPAHHRDGVRLRDGRSGPRRRASRSASCRSNTTRAAASRSSSSFRDGWRHLRFLLVHSPKHLFIFPGAVMATIGAPDLADVLAHVGVFGRRWDIHALIGGSLLLIVGAQVVALGLCARAYGDLLHGRARPLVRADARALPPRARPHARRSHRVRGTRDHRSRSSWSGSNAASAASPRSASRSSPRRCSSRDPSLLHLVPAQHPWIATQVNLERAAGKRFRSGSAGIRRRRAPSRLAAPRCAARSRPARGAVASSGAHRQ